MAKSRETFRSLLAKSGVPLEKLAKVAKVPRFTLYRLATDPPAKPWGRTLQRIAEGLTKLGVPGVTVERVEAAIDATRAAKG